MSQVPRIGGRAFSIVAISVLIALPAPAITLPSGFSDTLVATVGAPTALAFTPDGRLLVTTQGGTLRVISGGTLLPTPALSLGSAVCSNSERGLLGVAIDPSFAANHYVYLYYTFNKNAAGCPTSSTTTPVERISRFTLDVPTANVIDPATELVLLDGVLNFAGNHNGGQLRVGPDGYLYAGIGDGGCDYAGDSGCGGRERRVARPEHPEREDRPDRDGRLRPARRTRFTARARRAAIRAPRRPARSARRRTPGASGTRSGSPSGHPTGRSS